MGEDAQSSYISRNIAKIKDYSLTALFALGMLYFLAFYVNFTAMYYVGGIFVFTLVFGPAVCRRMKKKRISVDGKAVFISGCDRGFGYMFAQKLDDIGFHVFAGCLFPEGDGAQSLRKSASERLHVIGLDVTSDSSIQKAVQYVEENLPDKVLWAIINNAGIGDLNPLPGVSMESMQKTFDVNTFGVVRLTKAFLQKLIESKGRVVTVASVLGRFTMPYGVPYSMSKTAVITFCDGLRLEMYKENLKVITIEPIFYSTPMTDEVEESLFRECQAVPRHVKDMYAAPENLQEKLQKIYKWLKLFRRHPREVVTVMEEAVTTLYPEYSYMVGGRLDSLFLWLLTTLPKPISDVILHMALQFFSQ